MAKRVLFLSAVKKVRILSPWHGTKGGIIGKSSCIFRVRVKEDLPCMCVCVRKKPTTRSRIEVRIVLRGGKVSSYVGGYVDEDVDGQLEISQDYNNHPPTTAASLVRTLFNLSTTTMTRNENFTTTTRLVGKFFSILFSSPAS